MATIRDVADAAGVSVTTVSHALSGKRPVAPATSRRILQAVASMNYQPSQLAIAMLTGRTMTLGALVPDIKNPFFGELLSAVESEAKAQGYGTIVASTELRQDDEPLQIDMLCGKKVDALLLIGCSDQATLHAPTEDGAPVVVLVDQIAHPTSSMPLVTSDHAAGGRLAADHLWELGHRDVGVVQGPSTMAVANVRLEGFLDRMLELGSPVPRHRLVAADSFTVEGGLRATVSLLVNRPSITSVFCANDLIAYGAIHAASQLGIAVPTELSVIGFDDIFVSSMVQPRLTTVRQDIALLGRRAVQIALLAVDGQRSTDFEVPLDVELVVRESTAPPGSRTTNS